MKKVVSFSGGRTSAYLCYLMKERFGDDVDFVFMDTGAEHPKTYEFIGNVDENFMKGGLAHIRTSYTPIGTRTGNEFEIMKLPKFALKTSSIKGRLLRGLQLIEGAVVGCNLTSWKGMTKKYGVPYIGGMFCNDRMKLVPYNKYCNFVYGKKGYQTWLGIRFDEPARLVGDHKKKELSVYKQLKSLNFSNDEISTMYCEARGGLTDIDDLNIPDHVKVLFKNRLDALDEKEIHYLAELDMDFDKEESFKWWAKQNFDLDIPDHLGNCVFCPKKSDLKLAAAQRDEPKLYQEFLDMIYSDEVRHDNKTGHWSQMYRGKKSLEQVIGMFESSTGDEIKSRIRGARMTDTGSCSESCEVFLCGLSQESDS